MYETVKIHGETNNYKQNRIIWEQQNICIL